MTLYATLAECKAQMEAYSSTDDTKLLGYIRQVSNRIDRTFMPKRRAPVFAPYIETRSNFRLLGERVNSWDGTFYFGEPLLALTAVSVGTQTPAVGTDVQLYQGEVAPYMTLQLIDRCCNSWYRYVECSGCAAIPFITITGTWGYNIDWGNAWLDTLQTITNVGGINASATSFTVTDPEAANASGITPAFSPGALIQIDSEWLEVTGVNGTTNTVTVKRGVNGSTAAAHAQGTAVYAFQVEEPIKRAVAKQAGYEYAGQGAYPVKNTGGTSAEFNSDVVMEFETLTTLFANF
jgi:hypothetical protein